ncbi:AraC family transcriptional regulator [Cellulomonas chengniuliangii]|uniref:AraC family transcriptional regulator n=1 Tax=Cellulomonas chengniuliangii TaxID=2968084 RepID=A0ABY5L4A7_9CELL|nr:AraC family transcriptional regulator [Cellulomonas chengniuliangii]MCC2308299.1 AraC family transcriptional regulator [Cellulomonas chengniuliangii]MCC2317307.1 AraC family transcriptional regulator [Cellulomonas chengniuliangii]UUI76683.1 AraC family transcriptional regulator [Cellulomonas chengniuliangii]
MNSIATTLESRAVGTLRRRAVREVIAGDPVSSFRFYVHEDPHPFAGWHFHPEYELHLILRSSGRYVLGDVVDAYNPGQLVLVGPNLPHHWIADHGENEVLEDTHAVLHFSDAWIRGCQTAMPELRTLDSLLSRSAHGIEFQGDTAARGATALLAVRDADPGMERLVRVLDVLRVLAAGPAGEQKPVVRGWLPALGGADSELISRAIDYILDNLTTGASLHEAARQAAMSDSAFSRYFKAGSGQTFTDMVRQLRLTQACRLLERTDDTVGAIAGAVGYSNLSNFNRQFLRAYGVTPRQHRTSARA